MAGIIAGAAISAGASLLGSANSARAARDAANTQAEAARESGQLSYQISQQQLAAQKEALDRQIAASGATVDKQLLAQRNALDQQLSFQEKMYLQTREDFAPYRASGTANLNQLNTLLGIGGNTGAADYGRFATADFTPANFAANQDPGYGFRMSEGLKAVDRQAAARGGLISGNALKASQAFGQDMASQEYQNAFNRFQTIRGNTLQPFQMGAAAGQSAAAMQGQANANFGSAGGQAIGQFGQGASGIYGNAGNAMNTAYGNYGAGTTGVLGAYGTNATNALTGAANAQASGIVGGANAFNQGLSGISNLANTYYLNNLLSGRNQANTIAGLNSTYGANNVYGAGAANYQPSIPTSGYFGSE
jgi:hypothetical protein